MHFQRKFTLVGAFPADQICFNHTLHVRPSDFRERLLRDVLSY